MFIQGSGYCRTYPPKGFELPPRPATDNDPWQGYLDVLEMQGRPPVLSNEFHLASSRLTLRQQTADQLAAKLAAENPPEPLPDTNKDWQRASWRPWMQRRWGPPHHHHGWGGGPPHHWGGGRGYPYGRYNNGGQRGC